MKSTLILIAMFFTSIDYTMNYGPSLENIPRSEDTQLMPYFPAHVRMVRLVNGAERSDEPQMPAFFYHETILAAHLQPPTPSEIAYLAAQYQATHSLPDGSVRHYDGSINSRREFEQAIGNTISEAAAIKSSPELNPEIVDLDKQIQEVTEGKDYVSRVLTTSRIPLLLAGGAITAASIMRSTARRKPTRFISLTALTELPKAVYIIMLAGVAAKYVWQAACTKWLVWSRDRATQAADRAAQSAEIAKKLSEAIIPRVDKLEQANREKECELEKLRNALAEHKKAEQEALLKQECAIKSMIDALRAYVQAQLDKLTQQFEEQTQTDDSSHQQLRQDLFDVQESLNDLFASSTRQADILSKMQVACAHIESIASKIQKR
jgi:hypothetical protein